MMNHTVDSYDIVVNNYAQQSVHKTTMRDGHHEGCAKRAYADEMLAVRCESAFMVKLFAFRSGERSL